MARYTKTRYGLTAYGKYDAYSGEFLSRVYDSEAAFSGALKATWNAQTPTMTYPYSRTDIITYTGTWTQDNTNHRAYTSTVGDKLTFYFMGYSINATYVKNSLGGVSRVFLDDVDCGTINTYNVTETTETYSDLDLEYGPHKLEIINESVGGGGGQQLAISDFIVGSSIIIVDIKAGNSLDSSDGTWTNWFTFNITSDSGNITSSADINDPLYFGNKQCFQTRVTMKTSDRNAPPILQMLNVDTASAFSHVPHGEWTIVKHIEDPSFEPYGTVTWNATTPAGTTLKIQTQTSRNGTDWSPISNPYDQTVVNQVVLVDEALTGSFITPTIDLRGTRSAYDAILKWTNIAVSTQIPSAIVGATPTIESTSITYEIYNDQTSPAKKAVGPLTFDALLTYIKKNILALFKIKIKVLMSRTSLDIISPSIDYFSIDADVRYQELINPAAVYISSVENNNTGIKDLYTIASLGFHLPVGATGIAYTIRDYTNRASVESVSYSSDSLVASTTDSSKHIYVKSTAPKYYQFNNGMIGYDEIVTIPIGSTFTSLDKTPMDLTKECKYFIVNGFANNLVLTERPNVQLYWYNAAQGATPIYTTLTSSSSDKVTIKLTAPKNWEVVNWASQEFIKDIPIPINANNIENSVIVTEHLPAIPNTVIMDTDIGQFYVVNIIPGSITIDGESVVGSEDLFVYSETPVDGKIAYYIDPTTKTYTVEEALKRGEEIITVVRATGTNSDELITYTTINSITSVITKNANGTTKATYNLTTDYTRDKHVITWVGSKPADEEIYYVTFTYDDLGDLLSYSRIDENSVWVSDVSPVVSNQYAGKFKLLQNRIVWDPGPAPTKSATYYVKYNYDVSAEGTLTFSPSYKETEILKDIWVSNVRLKNWGLQPDTQAECSVDDDYISEKLPEKLDTTVWVDLQNVLGSLDTDSLKYTLSDNNQLVITYIDNIATIDATPLSATPTTSSRVMGTLKAKFNSASVYGRYPHNRWWPTITPGFYYLNKDEYYLFSRPMKVDFSVSEDATPIQTLVFTDGDGYSWTETAEVSYNGDRMLLDLSPVPRQGAPVIVKTMTGATPVEILLRKVSFVDENGLYKTYVTEEIEYISSDIRLAYDNLDSNFIIIITKEDGTEVSYTDSDSTDNIITINDIIEFGEILTITYQPKDCYSIEYIDGVAKLIFGEHYDNLIIIYEEDEFNNKYIATELEVNPILSPITEGFICVNKKIEDIKSLNVRITPDSIVANGLDRLHISIEPLDKLGNIVPESNLEIKIIPDESRNTNEIVIADDKISNYNGIRTISYKMEKITYEGNFTEKVRITEQTSGLVAEYDVVLRGGI